MRQIKPFVQIILDGVGIGSGDAYDAWAVAQTPFCDTIFSEKSPLFTTLSAHGLAVGLPSDSDLGNSEVGHNALGAGQIVNQGASQYCDAKR